MKPLSPEQKKQVRLNLTVAAALFLLYTVTYLLRYEDIHFLAYLEAGGTILLVAAFLHRFQSLYFLGIAAFGLIAQYGGVMFGLYDLIPVYDLLLHLASGVLLVLLGDYFLKLLLQGKTPPPEALPTGFILVFCWLFSLSGAVLWEILEFSLDRLFGTDCQRWTLGFGGLMDTMTDIMMGTLGAVLGLPLLWLTLRKNKKPKAKRKTTR